MRQTGGQRMEIGMGGRCEWAAGLFSIPVIKGGPVYRWGRQADFRGYRIYMKKHSVF